MGEYLSFVSVEMWTLIFSWVNLLILFLLLKKFLFKPVNNILKRRSEEIEREYTAAENSKAEADRLKNKYGLKLKSADDEANNIISAAVEKANNRSETIIDEARDEAKHIIDRGRVQTELERSAAVEEARSEVASMAVDIAEKLLREKLDGKGDKRLIEDIIKGI